MNVIYWKVSEHVYMGPEVNLNQYEISFRRGKISLPCKVISLPAFTWPKAKWNSFRCKFYFGQFDECLQWNKVAQNQSLKLITSAHVRYYCYWKGNQYRNICFALSLHYFKSYHLRMCKRTLAWFGKLPQWNSHVNRTTFRSGLSSLRVSWLSLCQKSW